MKLRMTLNQYPKFKTTVGGTFMFMLPLITITNPSCYADHDKAVALEFKNVQNRCYSTIKRECKSP